MAEATDDPPATGSAPAPLDLPHRADTRVQVGTPIHVGGERPWLCAVKLMGRRRETNGRDEEPTQTLFLRTARGTSPEEAQRAALALMTHVVGRPGEPVPEPIIQQKPSDPPPPADRARSRQSWMQRLARLFSRGPH